MRPIVQVSLDLVDTDEALDTAARDGNDMHRGDAPNAPA
jgi:hypothetical protein